MWLIVDIPGVPIELSAAQMQPCEQSSGKETIVISAKDAI